MMLDAPGYENLITALYPEGDEYIMSDAVFGRSIFALLHIRPGS